jgi:hypothetical protein
MRALRAMLAVCQKPTTIVNQLFQMPMLNWCLTQSRKIRLYLDLPGSRCPFKNMKHVPAVVLPVGNKDRQCMCGNHIQ